ncbi:MAG: hypothetical protein NVV73_15410 [Cellvibrionaceae bacterium]|nr:hypothetical protein [Cellvibrionaceae bacterium]
MRPHGFLKPLVTTSVLKVKFDRTSGARVCPSNAGTWLRAFGGPVFTGGPEGSGIPLELELELEEELLVDEELLLELELLELELLELDELELELELLAPVLPLELLLPPQATNAVARSKLILAFVSPVRLTGLVKRFIKHIPTVM